MACKDVLPFKIKNKILIGDIDNTIYNNTNINIGNSILDAFKSKPDFIGQVDAETGNQTTFQQMRENSVKCALWLKKKDIGKCATITICTSNHLYAYVPLLACIYIGATVNPWHEDYLENETRTMYFLLEDSPDVIFIDVYNVLALRASILQLRKSNLTISPIIVAFGEMDDTISLQSILDGDFSEAEIDEFSCADCHVNYLAILTFSFNSIQYPGEVQIPYLTFITPSNQQSSVILPDDVGLWYGDFTWTRGLLLTVHAILSFVTAIKSSIFNEEKLYQEIEKYKVTWVFLESSMCNELRNTDILTKHDVSSLKRLVFGDSPIKREIHEGLVKSLPNVSIIQVYSMSETGVIAYQRNGNKIGSSGYVAKNNLVMFVDIVTRQQVGPNVRSEIWCKTPYVMTVYDENKRLYSQNDMTRYLNKWYFTGDVGYYDKDGEIFLIDKERHIIKYKDQIVSSAEIEDMLQRHPAVSEVAVVPVPYGAVGQYPRAYVSRAPGVQVTRNELKQFVAKNLADSCKLRGDLFFVSSMPYLPNGKIDKMRLKNKFVED